MATIPELLDGHITLEVECLDRLYLNGYIGRLATGPELSMFMRNQLGKPVPSPVVLGTGVGEIPRGREDAGGTGRHTDSPVQTRRTERRHRQQLPQATTFNGKKVNGWFEFEPDKSVYVNHYYFYIDDEDFGPLFIKISDHPPWESRPRPSGSSPVFRTPRPASIPARAASGGSSR